jgi:hypothetical protein
MLCGKSPGARLQSGHRRRISSSTPRGQPLPPPAGGHAGAIPARTRRTPSTATARTSCSAR